jgi:hypothetical protein
MLYGAFSCSFSERTVTLEMRLVEPLVCSRVMREAGVCFLISEHVFGKISFDKGSPGPAQLHLVGTKIYFDKSTRSFWLKLLPENPTS